MSVVKSNAEKDKFLWMQLRYRIRSYTTETIEDG